MKTLTLFTLLSAVLLACHAEPPLQSEAPRLTSAEPPGWPDLGRGAARFIRIDLGPDDFEQCQRISPKFPFDSAKTYVQHDVEVEALAKCLDLNGMRDRTLLLVGRADPRGTDKYNDKLGMKRAQAIKKILVANGIDPARIKIATEGERGAKGESPDYAYGYDRRVDVIVIGGAHSP